MRTAKAGGMAVTHGQIFWAGSEMNETQSFAAPISS